MYPGGEPTGSAAKHSGGTGLDLRQYLDILKRHKWFVVEACLVLGLAVGGLSSLRTPTYRATATVLLRPNDPTEQLNPNSNAQPVGADADRFVTGQRSIARSTPVAQEAAKALRGVSAKQIQDGVSVTQGGQSNVLAISAEDPQPGRARGMANAVAKGYIENRRQAAVAGLERAAKDIQDKLGPLQAQIGQLDVRLGLAGGTGGTSQLVSPVPPVSATAPAQTTPPTALGIDPGGVASTDEALKAARYAAAVQYETLYARQQELLVDISLKRGEAELVAEANLPSAPVSPDPLRDGVLGGFVGLMIGVGVSLLREQLDDRLRSADEVEQISGLPMLARLPLDEETAQGAGGVPVLERPNSPLAEAFRSLRTSIQYVSVDQPVRLIVITSSVPGEGKSLVAANLAAIFAQADYRTLLVSADLRRSSIDSVFGEHPQSRGLTGLLAPMRPGGAPIGRANGSTNGNGDGKAVDRRDSVAGVVKTPVRNLLLLPSGPAPPNPAEMLGSRRMASLLSEWSATADIVILDTPPLLAVTDAAVLAAKADGVILVAAVNETKREAVASTRALLDSTGARLLGVVANKISVSEASALYYGGYYSEGPGEAKPPKVGLSARIFPSRSGS